MSQSAAITEQDADVAAVRSVMDSHIPDQRPPGSVVAQVAPHADESAPAARATQNAGPGARIMQAVRSYRPERRAVLVTSAVLLLLLQPVFVVGWGMLFCILAVAFYLIIGEERFWRGVIRHYRRYARRQPDKARMLKARAWVIARRWDRYLGYLPEQFADTLRSPDLREMINADRRHVAALTERLNRLESERPF